MATIATTLFTTTSAPRNNTPVSSPLAAFLDALFAVKLREELDAKTNTAKTDARYTWGM